MDIAKPSLPVSVPTHVSSLWSPVVASTGQNEYRTFYHQCDVPVLKIMFVKITGR
jgi:hypothetical protein